MSAHPKRHVKDEAEDAANRKLPQRLLKKRAAIDDDLKNKEKDVGETNEKAHRQISDVIEHESDRAHRSGTEPRVCNRGNSQRQDAKTKKEN